MGQSLDRKVGGYIGGRLDGGRECLSDSVIVKEMRGERLEQ